MKLFKLSSLTLCASASLGHAARKPADSVLLSNVQTLTLRNGLKTSHRRVAAVPQLKCVGGNAKGLYEVDVMRCKNAGADYDDDNVQWTCTASLPSEFKLGSTDVICEGYESSNDPYVLKGSCGVEYRLILTEQGEKKYDRRTGTSSDPSTSNPTFPATLFWILFVGVILWMLYSAFVQSNGPHRGGTQREPRYGGGGGGWGDDDGDDPPPPYDYHSPKKPRTNASRMNRNPAQGDFNLNWRPGFWTGALGGAAAGYAAGNRNRGLNQNTGSAATGAGGNNYDPGVGSSTRPSSGSSNAQSTTRYESTGFGTSSRR
ncbi:MAG: hypothetical protein M1820_000045 [Bogoriella megaspora]|nr:MAG: hypothetical protein M1820_000045 [Bogoriella megaspora]